MLAQRCPLVFGAKQPAPLQDRDDLGAENLELRRQQRRHDVEPVRRPVGKPVLDQIGDLLGRPRRDEMPPRAGEISQQLP